MLSASEVAEAGTKRGASTRRPHTKGEITMSKITAFVSVTLDGVMQAPSTTLTEPLPWSNSTLSRHDTTVGPR
jgi:hypothetical protein